MGSGAGLLVTEGVASRPCILPESHAGEGTEFPNNETPSTADGGADAVNE